MDAFTTEIDLKNCRIQKVEGAVKRVRYIAEREQWSDIGVKDALSQLLVNQHTLQDKVSDLEGRSS